jgi:purine catabolism regulator
MATLKEVLKIGLLNDLKIITGENNLDTPVKTVTVMEVPEVIRYLRGDDFLITSLYAIHDDEDKQCQLVLDLAEGNAACLAIKLGKYANNISEKMIAVAKENNFVLLEIPSHITYIDIIMTVTQYILTDTSRDEIISKYLNDILLENYIDEQLMLQRGRFLGINERAFGFSCLVFMPKADVLDKNEARALKILTKHCAMELHNHFPDSNFFLADFDKASVILIEVKMENELTAIIKFINKNVDEYTCKLFPQDKYHLGIGSLQNGFAGIRQTFQEAIQAIKIGQKLSPVLNLYSHQDMEIYINLYEMFSKTKTSLFDSKLGKINSGELLDTLTSYIECDNNIEKTAKALFTHKNTITYRLNKIKEICGLDVRKQKDNFLIYLMLLEKKLLG